MQAAPILVVGATGTVGSELVSQLLQAGQNVRALVRDPVKARNKLGADVDLVVADLAKPESLTAAFAGIDKVFVLAPPVSDLEELEANALATAEQAGVGHVVYLSNFGAGTFDDDLWRAHGANEERLRNLDLAWTILRPVRFMSNTPYGWFSVREKNRLVEPHNARKVTLIDPRDIAAAAAVDNVRPREPDLRTRRRGPDRRRDGARLIRSARQADRVHRCKRGRSARRLVAFRSASHDR
jgi:uncharacterized protein YbjT (DUF2867 family)